MLDYRLKTFLELCKTMNYTEAGVNLHMTQPAVSQHIKYLEEYYGTRLFLYENRRLSLTEKGRQLYNFSRGLKASGDKIRENLQKIEEEKQLRFGATLTIGEYLMPKVLIEYYKRNQGTKISMMVSNTEKLLESLKRGDIDFALIEGYFNKGEYESLIFSKEEFVAIASLDVEEGSFLKDYYGENIIVREKGSGTREILEHFLYERNSSLKNFRDIVEIGNMKAIKEMVKNKLGISFMYKAAVIKELDRGDLKLIDLEDGPIEKEFNFVFLKNSLYREEYLNFYRELVGILKNIRSGENIGV